MHKECPETEDISIKDACYFFKAFFFSDDKRQPYPSGCSEWSDDCLKMLRFFFIEFCVNYRQIASGGEVMPSTMKGYIIGLYRFFKIECGYELSLLQGPMFNCKTEGLVAVMNSWISEQQARGMNTRNHNVLSPRDIRMLYASDHLDAKKSEGFEIECFSIFVW